MEFLARRAGLVRASKATQQADGILRVDSLEATIAAAEAAGGSLYMPIAAVDGYRFAMIQDLDGNPVGLIEPF